MIEKDKFLKIVEPLAIKFGRLEGKALNIDFEYLKYFSEDDLHLMVDKILTSRLYQNYPSLGEIYEVMEEITEGRRGSEKENKEDYICGACCDEGIVFWPDTEKATFCSCENGLRKRAAFEEYRQTEDAKRATRTFEEADVSGAKPGPRIYRKGRFGRELTEKWDERLRKRLEWKKINIGKK